jgi:DNA-directed RNA polymerase subunit RPC12/RpoP
MPKFCTTCGKPLQFEQAEICPGCGVRIRAPPKPPVKGEYRFQYGGRTPDQLADSVYSLFQKEGYQLIEGTKCKGIYGKGSFAMRILAGGFANYNKFSVRITEEKPLTTLEFTPAMSGMSGGVIGVVRLNNEFERIKNLIQQL